MPVMCVAVLIRLSEKTHQAFYCKSALFTSEIAQNVNLDPDHCSKWYP